MRKVLIILSVAIAVYSCNNGGNTKISGKLENSKDEKVYIQELTLTGMGLYDSTTVSSSGRFKFKLNITDPTFYSLRVGNNRAITLIAKPDEKINVAGDAKDFYKTYTVKGSEESVHAQALDRRMEKTTRGLDSLQNVLEKFANNPNIVNITRTLQNNYYRILDEQRKFTIDFIQKHPSSLASIMALYQQTEDSVFVLYKSEDVKYYSLVDSLIYPKYPKASYVKAMHNNIENIKAHHKQEELRKIMSALGSPAQNFTLPDLSGKEVSLSSFKGSPVLLYFWASWCDSCRADNPEMLAIANKYKAKGLKVVAVSLDANKDVWSNAIKKDGLTNFTHLGDLKYWNSPVVPLYNIENIPLSFIIDKDGTIISRSINAGTIDQRLELLLK